MNKVVIVEDTLGRGISLAEQFEELAHAKPDLNIEVSDICYFCTDEEKANEDIKEAKKIMTDKSKSELNIRPVKLFDFNKIMDEYLYSEGNHFFLIIDFILCDDGSDGVPMKRVNIRYARNKNRCATNQLWFYTGTGITNKEILDDLVGIEHTLEVAEVDDDYLRLHLEDDKVFMNALLSCQTVEG